LLEAQLSSIQKSISKENILSVERIFELANKAHSLYLSRDSADRGRLLKSVLLNCTTDGTTLLPTYRKPFNLIFERVKTEDWSACYGVFEPGCSITGIIASLSRSIKCTPLGIGERTVKAHVAKLMRKVGVENRVALTVHAITHSLVSLH